MKTSPFRIWVQEIWYQNSDEHLSFHENPLTMKDYWDQYKYWLKREYRHRQLKGSNEA